MVVLSGVRDASSGRAARAHARARSARFVLFARSARFAIFGARPFCSLLALSKGRVTSRPPRLSSRPAREGKKTGGLATDLVVEAEAELGEDLPNDLLLLDLVAVLLHHLVWV